MSMLLEFDTGQQELLAGTALLGRDPEPFDKFPGAQLISIADPDSSVSGTHLAIGSSAGQVWVMDLASTNGTEVITKAGRARALTAMVKAELPAGARVVLGMRTMRVRQGNQPVWTDRKTIG
jgi:hypothetical protein